MKSIMYLLIFIPFIGLGQTISTFAGTGVSGYGGDGLIATNAKFGIFGGIACDINNNYLYIADGNNNRIRKVDMITNIITTIAGTGTSGFSGDDSLAINAKLNSPNNVAVDKYGNVYINDAGNNRIRKIDTFGIITTYAGTGYSGDTGDNGPATAATFYSIIGIATDDTANLYLCDPINNKIRKIQFATNIITTVIGTGVPGYTGDNGPATAADIHAGHDISIDHQGNMYIVDYDNYRIRKVTASTGIITTFAGNGAWAYTGDGILATNAPIDPNFVTTDFNGNVIISDFGNFRIRTINKLTNIISTTAGNGISGFYGDGGPATDAEFYYVYKTCFDNCGNLYIADGNNYRVRKITYPQALPTMTITASYDSFCAGNSVTLMSSYAATVPGTAGYQWIVNGSAVSGATSSTYNYNPASGDSVRCVLTFSSNCGGSVVSSNTVNMTLVSSITPTIALPTGIFYASAGTVITVNAVLTDTPISYLINWFNKGVWFAGTTTPWVTYTKTMAIDSITAHIAPSGFCYDSAVSSVEVVIDSVLGVQSVGIGMGVRLYPNPAHDVLELETSGNCCHWQIMDLPGRGILQGDIKGNRTKIDIERLPAGVYVVRIDGIVAGRFVKLSEP